MLIMLNTAMQGIRISASAITQNCKSKYCVLVMIPHGRRCLSTSSRCFAKVLPRKRARVVPEIAGLEPITYADRMHFVPGLAKPTFPPWERGWTDPRHSKGPKLEEKPLYKDKPCYIFNQRSNVLEGSRQALWLSKSVLVKGLPDQILSLAEDTANQIENQDERVQNAILSSRLWDTTDELTPQEKFCPLLVHRLLELCGGLQVRLPKLGKRMLAEKYTLAVTWRRGEDIFQVRGRNGLLLNSMTPLPVLAGPEQIQSTADQVLETFFPIEPTIDLQCAHVYEERNYTGFKKDYPYPHAHTLFVMELGNTTKLYPDKLRAKSIMFSFGNALARAKDMYGDDPRVLEKPIVVQSIATDGRCFEFVVFQLNTTDLQTDSGVKNLVWIDGDQLLFDETLSKPIIKKRVVKRPAGLSGYNPDVFKKFLAMYLHGAT